MRFSLHASALAVVAAASFAAPRASAQASAGASGSAGASVSGSATVQIGGPGQPPPPPAPQPAPPPPVVYAPPPATVTNAPPPPPPPAEHGAYLHDGFYFRFGIGGGGLSAKGKEDPDRGFGDVTVKGGGIGVDFAFGGTLAPGLVLGGEYVFQQAVKPTVESRVLSGTTNDNANFGVIGPFIDWYPDPSGGFHFGGLLGLAAMTASRQDGTTNASDRGVGAGLGVGYDFFVAREWSLGILGKAFGGSVSNTTGNTTEKFSVSAFSLMFSVLYH